MGANNSSLTSLNCILKNWDRFDPQSLKKTCLIFLCDTAWPWYPLEDGKPWPVERSLNYNTVLQLDQFCIKQGKWVEVAYVLPFIFLRDMPDLCPKGIDLGMKPSAPSCPPTLSLYPGLQTDKTESQGTPPTPKGCLGLRRNSNWDSNCPSRGPNNPCLSTTWDYSGFNRNSDNWSKRSSDQRKTKTKTKLRVKYRIRLRTGDKEIKKNRFLQSIPGIICAKQLERLKNSHTSCWLFMKHPPGEIINLCELISPFLIKKYKESMRI